jgi:membrane-associated protease RseP (regulator of RpoE activity)
LKPFAEKHDLVARLNANVEGVTGWGVGGPAKGLLARVKTLHLGAVAVQNSVAELSLQTHGSFISPYVAGNVGAGVLKRFNITFDYPHQQLVFERNANYDKPDTFDRSGMWVNKAGDNFEVMDVIASSPAAAAGLKVGDKISSVDGRAAGQVPLPELRARFRTEAPGTRIKLTVQSGTQTRDVVLVLKDLV